jgi:CBS domain-containing protein
MKCAEIMTINPVMCVPDDNVSVAINLMWDYDCGNIPVVKDMESKELVGVVTDRDIVMSVIKHINAHHSQIKVGDCMASPVITCQPEDSIEKIIDLMGEHRVRRIPIVDEKGCCLGIISQADLLLNVSDIESVINLLRLISTRYSEDQTATADLNEKTEALEKTETLADSVEK